MTARRYKTNEIVDFVVVGSGAAGGVMWRIVEYVDGGRLISLEQWLERLRA